MAKTLAQKGVTRTQEKRGIAMTYGDAETALAPNDAARFLENRLRLVPANENGQGIDNSLLSYADKYGLGAYANVDSNADESFTFDNNKKARILAESAIDRLLGVDGRFDKVTAESLLRMNKEYFGCLIDASYSQDTNAPTIVARGIEACEGLHGSMFTSTELFESGEYIVNDYPALIQHGLSVRKPASMERANAIEAITKIGLPDLNDTMDAEQKEVVEDTNKDMSKAPEQLQLDFGEAVDQLSFDLDEGLER